MPVYVVLHSPMSSSFSVMHVCRIPESVMWHLEARCIQCKQFAGIFKIHIYRVLLNTSHYKNIVFEYASD